MNENTAEALRTVAREIQDSLNYDEGVLKTLRSTTRAQSKLVKDQQVQLAAIMDDLEEHDYVVE